MNIVAIIFVAICFSVPPVFLEISFRQTSYYKQKKTGYFRTLQDKGSYGEYLIYKKLRVYEKTGARFIFNLYLPSQSKNVDATEIDVVMITTKGIYVFESKNYSGWIFGNDKQKTWAQCLPQGKGKKALKEQFFNPVWQNNAHIKALHAVIKSNNIPTFSIITFSDRCTLKEINLSSNNHWVVKRRDVPGVARNIDCACPIVFDQNAVERLFVMLMPYSNVSDELKMQHISQIKNL